MLSIREQIMDILSGIPPTLQLKELENLRSEIAKANGLRIENERVNFSRKYPRQKEESNDYKR